jgi:hypothetical protein
VSRDVTKNCKEEKKRLYQTTVSCKKKKHICKTIENVDYMCLGICKEVARHCKEKEKTYQTIVIYCMKRGHKRGHSKNIY